MNINGNVMRRMIKQRKEDALSSIERQQAKKRANKSREERFREYILRKQAERRRPEI